ncbi:MAG: hypothetical protein LUD22_00380 [Coprobacillus sp.]|nr:hypothetical protein [Coprobacillus sp.]
MSNKKGMKVLTLCAIGVLGLASCDEIVAKPSDYDDEILTILGYDEEIYNNVLSVIYDAIRDGSLASDVLDEVLYQFSISVFGRYNELVNPSSDSTTLKAAVKDIADHTGSDGTVSGASIANEFIKTHKAYWSLDSEDNRLDDNLDIVENPEQADASQNEYARVTAKWNTIEERISETLYSTISGGSYSDRNYFHEEYYLMSLLNGFNNVENPLQLNEEDLTVSLIYPDIEEEEVFDTITIGEEEVTLLHREYYQSNYGLDESESVSANTNTYIEDKIIPDIYRTLLVEQYLLDESYNTLGRSYARKVNIISISDNEDHIKSASYLMNEFVKDYINAEPEGDDVLTSTNQVDLDTFKMLSNAWRGVDLTDEEKALLVASGGFEEAQTEDEETYYLGTKYGDLQEEIDKIDDNLLLTDTSIESELTGGYSYPLETGIAMAEDQIRLESFTTDGWYIKNGGLSELPDNIRSRLFNISVANAIQEGDDEGAIKYDRWQKDDNGNWEYDTSKDPNNYVAKINGKYYLKNNTTIYDETDSDVLFYDRDTSTYYIVQIEEAVSSSKLSKVSDNRYANTRGNDVMEDAVNNVAKLVAQTSSYSSLSTEYWLEQATLTYHDDVVYDYFYSNYPDLFDD